MWVCLILPKNVTLAEPCLVCCRGGFPVDIARAVQRYSVKSAVCVPVRLPAVVSEGNVVASERVLGTLTLASCHLDAVTSQ